MTSLDTLHTIFKIKPHSSKTYFKLTIAIFTGRTSEVTLRSAELHVVQNLCIVHAGTLKIRTTIKKATVNKRTPVVLLQDNIFS